MDGHPRRSRQRAPGQNPAYRPTPRHHPYMTPGASEVTGGARSAVLAGLVLVVAAALVTGCSGGRPAPGAVTEAATVDVPCSQSIDAVDDIGPSYVAQGSGRGFVALPSDGWLSSGVLQLGRVGSAGSELEGFRFAKFGLLVRHDRAVSLEVVRSPGEVVLDYVHPGDPAPVMSVGPCSSDREWVVFAGGAWVTEPGCVELLASSGDERIAIRLPVGAPCEAHP